MTPYPITFEVKFCAVLHNLTIASQVVETEPKIMLIQPYGQTQNHTRHWSRPRAQLPIMNGRSSLLRIVR